MMQKIANSQRNIILNWAAILCVCNVNELLLVCPMNLKQVNQNSSETLETIFNKIKS